MQKIGVSSAAVMKKNGKKMHIEEKENGARKQGQNRLFNLPKGVQ